MQLVNEFVVPRPIDQTWAVLNDVERIAPAMPGATLTDHVDDIYHGKVKVKVGPVTAQYGGTAQFRERDEAAHHMVLEATGKESSGRGRASAVVTADLAAEGTRTRVKVVTDLTISGPLAQFGRGAIAEVSAKLLGQFVSNLETMVLAHEPAPSTSETSTGTESAAAPAAAAPSTPAPSADGGAPAPAPAAPASAAPASAAPASAAPASAAPASAAPASAAPESNGTVSPNTVSPGIGSPGATSAPAAGPAAGSAAPAESTPPAATKPGPSVAPQAGAAASSVPATPRAQPAEAPAAEVNLLRVAAWPVLKRLIPVLVVIAVLVIVLVVWVF
jgi:carbon monoxide dehydrogenase subunit G